MCIPGKYFLSQATVKVFSLCCVALLYVLFSIGQTLKCAMPDMPALSGNEA